MSGSEYTPAHLWPCGCLRNDAGAHRVGCPDHPEGVRGPTVEEMREIFFPEDPEGRNLD